MSRLPLSHALRLLSVSALASTACATHHWAQIETAELPPPRAHELHASRLVIDTSRVGDGNQCVVHRDYSPVCFVDLKGELDRSLVQSTWPAFPQVVLGSQADAGPEDYVLQVDMQLDALPPDASGPGWSAGAKTRFRLLQGTRVLHEETLASRSEAEFAYGSTLGPPASSVVDASVRHIAERVSLIPESKQLSSPALPAVASRVVTPSGAAAPSSPSSSSSVEAPVAPAEPAPAASAAAQAKTKDSPEPESSPTSE
ncbi:MAG TPA: hypothetical protein VLC09_19350 [Polyangiaceae bacterium]|nr:hypothetical protein [Polyangiaceae bacterium]